MISSFINLPLPLLFLLLYYLLPSLICNGYNITTTLTIPSCPPQSSSSSDASSSVSPQLDFLPTSNCSNSVFQNNLKDLTIGYSGIVGLIKDLEYINYDTSTTVSSVDSSVSPEIENSEHSAVNLKLLNTLILLNSTSETTKSINVTKLSNLIKYFPSSHLELYSSRPIKNSTKYTEYKSLHKLIKDTEVRTPTNEQGKARRWG